MKRIVRILALLVLVWPLCAVAEEDTWQDKDFARIPVLHEGRIKPLGTMARVTLRAFCGEETIGDMSASQWFAQAIFAPEVAMEQPVFALHSAPLRAELGLPEAAQDTYSFRIVSAALSQHKILISALLAKDTKELSSQERALITLSENANQMAELVSALSLLAPLDVDVTTREALQIPAQADLSYFDIQKYRKNLDDKVKALVRVKHDDLNSYTPQEQRLVKLSYSLSVMESFGQENALFRVIPPAWNGSQEWLSLWAVVERGEGSPASTSLFAHWRAMAHAYQAHNVAQLQQEAAILRVSTEHAAGVRHYALVLEDAYHRYEPLTISLTLYGLTFLLVCVYVVTGWRLLSWGRGVMAVALLTHGLAITMRMAILLRPPVGTLYESMLFVSFVAAVFGMWLERKRAGMDGLLLGSIMAVLLLVAAENFAGENDTLGVLVAVLNTNFWLGTHVVCITTGYGASLAAGVLAHLILLHRAIGRMSPEMILAQERRLYHVALIALFFTATGTMLGGIWADQSWGRFWGWDPKENGALWIVIWLIWLLHGRIAGQLSPIVFAGLMSLITIVVALAWVGVNLLSVGLHSYGFTQAAAQGLVAFCGIELLLVGVLIVGARWARKRVVLH